MLWMALPAEDKKNEKDRLHQFLFTKNEEGQQARTCELTHFSPIPLVRRDLLNYYDRARK